MKTKKKLCLFDNVSGQSQEGTGSHFLVMGTLPAKATIWTYIMAALFFLFYSSRRIFWFSRQVMIIGGTYGFEVGSLADRSGKFRLEIKDVSRPQRKTWSRWNVGSV